MYLGMVIGQEDLTKAFGRPPLRMSEMGDGWLYKYPDFYIKIYPRWHAPGYEIQYFEWGAHDPYKVDIVMSNEIYTYASYIRNHFSNTPRR